MDNYKTISEKAEQWCVSPRWVQKLCTNGKIEGAVKFGHIWAIPAGTEKPIDGRITTGQYRNWRKK